MGKVSLEPVHWVSWNPQTTPGQLKKEEQDKQTEPPFTQKEQAKQLEKGPTMVYAILHNPGTFSYLIPLFKKALV